MDGGNFGAPPNPPCTPSYAARSDPTASSSSSGVISPRAVETGRASRPTTSVAADSTSARRFCQVAVTEASTSRKAGIPPRRVGGQYVPQ